MNRAIEARNLYTVQSISVPWTGREHTTDTNNERRGGEALNSRTHDRKRCREFNCNYNVIRTNNQFKFAKKRLEFPQVLNVSDIVAPDKRLLPRKMLYRLGV